ncbi:MULTISPECIES: hypothetical protein [Legionella]|uniref:hypothetical protein n=1 Tax=Legionella TaxID=445 RepID=UPI00095F890E|nr:MULTISPECIES: hypothetical protein [Legionella]MBN9228586.1 hypothetical protein [Legionella steelei]OJW08095.1 MAG: hypothetical protein BGO44_12415 [Legionella sp. 39-23]
MFGITTKEKISELLLTSYAAWDGFISHIWASLLSHCNLPLDGVFVEIAPGTSPKIALALKEINFNGEIYIIEPYEKALDLILSKYQEILPEVIVHPVNHLLKDCFKHLPKSIDCIISHHPLDDMIMAMDGEPEIFEKLFSWVSQDKLEIHQSFALHWQQILAQPEKVRTIENQIINQWFSLIKKVNPRWLMISQYPSLVLEAEYTKELNLCAQKLLLKIKSHLHTYLIEDRIIQSVLNNYPNYNFDLLGNEVLNSKNWLIYSRQ